MQRIAFAFEDDGFEIGGSRHYLLEDTPGIVQNMRGVVVIPILQAVMLAMRTACHVEFYHPIESESTRLLAACSYSADPT